MSKISTIPSFDDLPDSAFIRASHLVRDPKHPGRAVPLQISMSTLWRYCQPGGTVSKAGKAVVGDDCMASGLRP